ncbi:MAG: glycerol-3-phosphate 1-O-acyltransferase PlsY [Bacillota bacterium]|nr:glycerol-3-phosphate 1-O-acyltransferase PlsY [Bacillota bacterium]
MFRLICMIIGYCVGCIETAYVVGKLWKVDLRKHGSGNLGTTNALRVLGKKAGAMVFIGDILKSVIAFLICRAVFQENWLIAGVYGSAGAILGHNYPFYLNFKGGKGIAVMIGMTAAMAFSTDIRLALPTAIIGFGLAFATRYVSVGSLAFAVTLPVSAYLLGFEQEVVLVTVCAGLLAFWRHRKNIRNLLNGTENRFGSKKK